MEPMVLQVELDTDANPKNLNRGSEEAAGLDLYGKEDVVIEPGKNSMFDTGVRVALPKGTVGVVRPRSSAFKQGLVIQGTIDSDYRGNLFVSVWNVSGVTKTIEKSKSIAQLVIMPYLSLDIAVGKLDNTVRGTGGFGSSGNNV